MKKNKTDYIIFENYIYPKILKYIKKYPNDEELGFHIRKLLTEKLNNNFPGIQNL
jgi:hypothetical protein